MCLCLCIFLDYLEVHFKKGGFHQAIHPKVNICVKLSYEQITSIEAAYKNFLDKK